MNIWYGGPAGVQQVNPAQWNHHVGRCGNEKVGAVMITNGSGAYAGPPISNTKIAHSLSQGIVSYADNTDTYFMSTTYPSVTFEDITGTQALIGQCDP